MSASVSADVSDRPHAVQPLVPGRLGRTFRALQHRDFHAFWLGQVVSNTGTWMQSIAQARGSVLKRNRLHLKAAILRGRSFTSIYTLLFLGSTPIGSMVVGYLAEHQGVQVALAEMALLCAIGVAGGLLYVARLRARPKGSGFPVSGLRQGAA